MNIKNIAVKLNDLGGIVNFETDNGAFDTVFVLRKDNSYLWVNYWEGYRVWGSDTNPKLDSTLKKHGLFAECVNPGEWGVYAL